MSQQLGTWCCETNSSIVWSLGNLGGDYQIKLKENATPYSLFPQCPNTPQPKDQKWTFCMDKMGVISKIIRSKPWCAGMVVIPRRSGAVRICVDLKPLNESILQEPHPISKVDDTLPLLHRVIVFSKSDANNGFWQNSLSETTQHCWHCKTHKQRQRCLHMRSSSDWGAVLLQLSDQSWKPVH